MTYRDYEDSVASGKPVELYDICAITTGTHWRLNTSTEPIVYGGFTYNAEVVTRNEIEIGGLDRRSEVELTLPRDHIFTNQYAQRPLDEAVSLTIYRQHVTEYATFWKGFLIAISFDEKTIPKCVFQPITSSGRTRGRRRCCQLLCSHVVYSDSCGLSMSTYESVGAIDSTGDNGLTIVSTIFSAKSSGYYTGGLLKKDGIYRFIINHAGDTVTLERSFSSSATGDTIYAYAGCDLDPDTCDTKFGNVLNFGGQEYLPVLNPFQSGTDMTSGTSNPDTTGRISRIRV